MPLNLLRQSARRSNKSATAAVPMPACNPVRMSGVKGLIFDMGDVLYDATVWRRWLWRLLSHMDVQHDYRSLFTIWDRDFLAAVHRGERDYHVAFREFLTSLGLRSGQIDEIEAASQAQRRMLLDQTCAYPGVAPTLAALCSAALPLAVLSDSESTSQQLQARLATLGLAGHFTGIVSSFDLKRTKPDPVCYQEALKTIGRDAGECAFVGHDADELTGAAAVGLRTIAFNFEPEITADVYLERFEQLLDVVPADGVARRQVA